MSTPDGGLRRSAAPDDRDAGTRRGRGRATAWVGAVGMLLAAAAAGVVVLSDDSRWLRLGVVAALWAALIAVLALARRIAVTVPAAEHDAEIDRLHRAYSDELDDEVIARREFEENLRADLTREVAAELSREMEERHGSEVAGLRAEIERLQARQDAALVPASAPVDQRAPQPREAQPREAQPREAQPPRTPVAPVTALPLAPPPGNPAPGRGPAPDPAVTVPSPLAAAYHAAASGPRAHAPRPTAPAGPVRPRTPPGGVPVPAPSRGPDGRRSFTPEAPGRASALARESFVDGYLRSAGYDPSPAEVSDPPGVPGPDDPRERWVHPMRTVRPAPGAAVDQEPAASWASPAPSASSASSTTTGRTVAELLAAHAAAVGSDPRPGRRSAS